MKPSIETFSLLLDPITDTGSDKYVSDCESFYDSDADTSFSMNKMI